jgi:hypothetical protein
VLAPDRSPSRALWVSYRANHLVCSLSSSVIPAPSRALNQATADVAGMSKDLSRTPHESGDRFASAILPTVNE